MFYSEVLNRKFEISEYSGKIRTSMLLYEILEEIRVRTNCEVKTLDDYNEGIKLIKKRR